MNKHYLQSGVSLIELLVSIAIGLVVISGVVSVVATSRETFVNEQESSFMQENLRYAIEMISRDIRASGDRVCAPTNASWFVSAINDSSGLFGTQGIQGYESGQGSWPSVLDEATSPPTGSTAFVTDAIIIRYLDSSEAVVVKSHNSSNNGFETISDHGFSSGEHLFVVDNSCRHYAYFKAGSASGSDITADTTDCSSSLYAQSSNYLCPGASSPNTSAYGAGSMILPYRSSAYFIADSTITPGVPALKRRIFTSDGNQRTEELAQGIETMEIKYGVDSSVATGEQAQNIDSFVDAAVDSGAGAPAGGVTDWNNVLAVRITFGLRSQSEFFDEAITAGAAGTPGSANTVNGVAQLNDRYLRSYANVTVLVRNGG